MNHTGILRCVIAAALLIAHAEAQLRPQTTTSLPLSGVDAKTASIPANTTATFLDMVLDAPVSGDFLDVLPTNPAVVITLVQPNSVEVTAANASSLGYTWTVTTGSGAVPGPFAAPVTHIAIGISTSAAAGVYRIKANSQGIAADSAISVFYMSQSGIRTGLIPSAPSYRVGETVILTAPVFQGTTPVASASITARVTPRSDVSSLVVIGSYQLVSTTPVDASTSNYVYRAGLVNLGPARSQVIASVASTSLEVRVIDPSLLFGAVPPMGSASSVDTFTVQRKNNLPFDPAVLQWTALAASTGVAVSLTDSGQFDSAPNDGLYTGSYTPTVPGEYSVVATVTGTSGGASFSRKASTSFNVISSLASFISFQDQAIDDNANGLFDRLVTTATVSVQSPGEYDLSMDLQASNGKTLLGAARMTLSAGQQQIAVTFRGRDIHQTLGVAGPYQRVRSQLVRREPGIRVPADARPDAGSTAAYALNAFDRGSLYLTGQDSATGVITTGGPLFDLLRVQAGVYTAGGQCSWHGGLMAGDVLLDFASGSATLTPGATFLTLNFGGMKISRSGRNGPYSVKDFGVKCGNNFISVATLLQTSAYTAGQFVVGVSDFSVSVTPATLVFGVASSGLARLALETPGLFQPLVYYSVSGLPAGVSAHFGSGSTQARVPTAMQLLFQASASAVPGSYPVTVQAVGGGLTRGASLTLQLTPRTGYSVGASPVGPLFHVDGSRYAATRSFPWFPNSIHSLEVSSPQNFGDSRYTFLNWSDGGAATHQITAPAIVTDYIANFLAEHKLNLKAEPPTGGSFNISGGNFHTQGSPVSVTATPNPGYQFQSWSGSVTNTSTASTTVVMTGPKNVSANFAPQPTSLSGLVTEKSGTGPRVWAFRITNSGPGAAFHTELVSLAFTQVFGTPCTPVSRTPLPSYVGEIAPGASKTTYVVLDFSTCTEANARFSVNFTFRANNGAVLGSMTLQNQFR